MLSTLVVEVDYPGHPSQHHFYAHDSTIDVELTHSSLIPPSSLQKLVLFLGAENQSWFECVCGLEFLDVRNVIYLELHSMFTSPLLSRHSSPSQNHHLSIFEAWQDRLVSLESLVLSSPDLLDFTGGNRNLIRSSHAGGIHLAIQTVPTFETHQEVLSSFAEIASMTYYLPPVGLYSEYDGVPTHVKERLSSVLFPITFIPTPRWQILLGKKAFRLHPLLVKEPMDVQPSCETVDFIRHVVEISKGGEIPVRFIDSPSYPPGFLSRVQYDAQFWDVWRTETIDGYYMGWGDLLGDDLKDFI